MSPHINVFSLFILIFCIPRSNIFKVHSQVGSLVPASTYESGSASPLHVGATVPSSGCLMHDRGCWLIYNCNEGPYCKGLASGKVFPGLPAGGDALCGKQEVAASPSGDYPGEF